MKIYNIDFNSQEKTDALIQNFGMLVRVLLFHFPQLEAVWCISLKVTVSRSVYAT